MLKFNFLRDRVSIKLNFSTEAEVAVRIENFKNLDDDNVIKAVNK